MSGTQPERRATPSNRRATRPLEALNFVVADMQAGIGPFLGVFLQQRGWTPDRIGLAMTLGGVAGIAATAPAGALIDATSRKRTYAIVTGIMTVLASGLIWLSQSFGVIALSQILTAIAGAAIVGITLGIVKQAGFNRQIGRNQAWNHAGNMVGAGLSGWLGYRFGFVAIFWLAAAFGVLSIVAVLLIPRSAIDDRAARGLEGKYDGDAAKGCRVLFECKPLLVLAAALALFHLGNGAMLPLSGLAVVAAKKGNPASLVAQTVIFAPLIRPIGVPASAPTVPA